MKKQFAVKVWEELADKYPIEEGIVFAADPLQAVSRFCLKVRVHEASWVQVMEPVKNGQLICYLDVSLSSSGRVTYEASYSSPTNSLYKR